MTYKVLNIKYFMQNLMNYLRISPRVYRLGCNKSSL
nr:MAG TPA: hypothetical protein [Caudoviricetes sp.]